MTLSSTGFYIPGGTLPREALSYVRRQADDRLYHALLAGEFCYILTPRQMGKSSLMAHTDAHLREAGVSVAVLDLTHIGQDLNAEQWYNGLLDELGKRLHLEDELEEFCLEQDPLSPLQRWQRALRDVALTSLTPGPSLPLPRPLPESERGEFAARVGEGSNLVPPLPPSAAREDRERGTGGEGGEGRLVIFIDEIDIVRALPFSTDEFFAAIRACYNARSRDPVYQRLTFCLLGVAAPTDLIRNPRLTPFNIGTRIDLDDFTREEAALLQSGLGRDTGTNRLLMERIFHWTGGHPYLTQRLCKLVAEDTAVMTDAGVDRCCERLFLAPEAGHRDDNLTYVRQRMLAEEEEERASLLTLYSRALAGQPVRDNEVDERVGKLKLSGVVRAREGRLLVRNRIYTRVFDRAWVREQMPDAELRRQRAAYVRGLLRAAAISAAILAVVVTLGYVAVRASLRANEERRLRAIENNTARLYRYVLAITRAQSSLQAENFTMAFRSLEQQRPQPHEKDLRGFEWRYLWQQCQGDQYFFDAPKMIILSIALSPDGRLLAAGGQDGSDQGITVRLWDTASRRETAVLKGPDEAKCMAFSPDGKLLAAGGGVPFSKSRPGEVKLWRVTRSPNGRIDLKELAPLSGFKDEVTALTFSPDGKTLVTDSEDKKVRLWDVVSHRLRTTLANSFGDIENSMAVSHDGKTLAFGGDAGQVFIYNVNTRKRIRILSVRPDNLVWCAAFSPDGNILATGGWMVRLWDVRTGRLLRTLPHPMEQHSVAFSPDGKTLATGCWDGKVRLWEVASGRERQELIGHLSLINSVAFTRDGRTLFSGGNDGTVRVWDTDPQHALPDTVSNGTPTGGIAVSPDGKMLATGGWDRMVKLWDAVTGRKLAVLRGHNSTVYQVVFSPDGKMLASASNDNLVRLWNVSTHRQIDSFPIDQSGEAAFSGDGKILLTTSNIGITLWDMASRKKIDGINKKYTQGDALITISPNGDTVAVVGHDVQYADYGDATIELWSLRKRQMLAVIRGASMNGINSLAFSPDGKTLATGGWDRRVLLWDVTRLHGVIDGRSQNVPARRDLRDFAGQVFSLAFSPDGKTLAVGNEDRTIKIWNLATQEEMAVLAGHGDTVRSVAFAPGPHGSAESNLLVSGSADGTVRFWRAAPFSRTDDPQRIALGDRIKR